VRKEKKVDNEKSEKDTKGNRTYGKGEGNRVENLGKRVHAVITRATMQGDWRREYSAYTARSQRGEGKPTDGRGKKKRLTDKRQMSTREKV